MNCSVLQEGKIKMFTKLLWQSVLWGRKSENPVLGGLMKWPPEKKPNSFVSTKSTCQLFVFAVEGCGAKIDAFPF